MSNYGYRSFPLSWLNQRYSVGDKLTSDQLMRILDAAVVLSSCRWVVSIYIGSGLTFSSNGAFSIFIPTAGTGRQLLQPWFCSNDTNATMPSRVRLVTQNGQYAIGQTTTTSSTGITIPVHAANYAQKKIFAPLYANSYSAISYRTPSQYGCCLVEWGGYAGKTPVNFGLWPYSIAYTTGSGMENYIASNGNIGYNFIGSTSFRAVGAGLLRVCEEMLDTAETMPIPLFFTPTWVNGSGSLFSNAALAVNTASNRARWVPIVNLGRPRALWLALSDNSYGLGEFTISINGYTQSFQTNVVDEYRVYSENYRQLYAVPISAEMLAASSRQVGGLPTHFISVNANQYIAGLCAWVGDVP